MGVFPVPPVVMFPRLMTGIGTSWTANHFRLYAKLRNRITAEYPQEAMVRTAHKTRAPTPRRRPERSSSNAASFMKRIILHGPKTLQRIASRS